MQLRWGMALVYIPIERIEGHSSIVLDRHMHRQFKNFVFEDSCGVIEYSIYRASNHTGTLSQNAHDCLSLYTRHYLPSVPTRYIFVFACVSLCIYEIKTFDMCHPKVCICFGYKLCCFYYRMN